MKNIAVEFFGFVTKRAIKVNKTGSRWVDCTDCSREMAVEYCKKCLRLSLIGLDLEDNKSYVWCKK